MEMHMTDDFGEEMAETPEDVAILYSWANLHGAKYRDFSASRREYRAQVRHRAAEESRQSELTAQAEAEAAAADAERIAREAERSARASERYDFPYDRENALREAEDAARRAAAERIEAARRAESAAIAEAAARREEREIAEAHVSAQRQEQRWHDSEIRRRHLAGPQPARVPSLGDPYEVAQGANVDGDLPTPNRQLQYTQPARYRDESAPYAAPARDLGRPEPLRPEERRPISQPEPEPRRPRGYRPDQASGIRPAFRPAGTDSVPRNRPSGEMNRTPTLNQSLHLSSSPSSTRPEDAFYRSAAVREEPRAVREEPRDFAPVPEAAPAWLYASNSAMRAASVLPMRTPSPAASGPQQVTNTQFAPQPADTLQQSRERVASRWFALKGVFHETSEPRPKAVLPEKELAVPALTVFSLAGGVGKTSLVATLGRALSSLGEKVLLADTTSHGLLPYYFGATELKPGVVRTFSPPAGSTDAAIHLVSYDVDTHAGDNAAELAVADAMMQSANGVQRLIIDFNAMSGWLMRRLNHTVQTVLVPVAPDMNSVISLQTVERYFAKATDHNGHALQPYYVLNQFDASLPLHLDVREVLRRQLGDRLLPFVIRRSPAVSEALAEGMTVVDYQPEGSISEDYLNIANWLRGISAPAAQGFRTTRWSER